MSDIHQNLLAQINSKQAVIWDFDGVICFGNWNYDQPLKIWWEKLWQLLEEFDPDIRSRFESGLKYPYEHTDYIVEHFGEEVLVRINELYLEKELAIMPGSPINSKTVEVILAANQGVEYFIWSNNQEAFVKQILQKAGIFEKFKFIATRDKVRLAKPNLDGFELIRSVTSIEIKNFLFVGDSKNTDQLAATKLGMDFFLYQP